MIRVLLYCLALFVIIGFVNCRILGGDDKEKPIVWEEESLEGLVVYGFTASDTIAHIVNLGNSSVTNIRGLDRIQSIAASTDGKYLYISTGNGKYGGDPGYITKIDTENWSSEKIYDRSVELETSDEQIYFITKHNHLGYDDSGNNNEVSHTRTFGRIEPSTGDVKIIDDIDIFVFGMSDDSAFEVNDLKQELFGYDADFRLFRYRINTEQSELIFQQFNYWDHGGFELSKDGNTLFFAKGPVLDLTSSKQIGSITSERPSHLIARKDKREIYISDPPTYTGAADIQPKMTVFNLKENSIIDSIDVGSVNFRMYLTPKERYLITHNRRNIFIVDLKTRELVKTIELSKEVSNFEKFYLFKQPITKGDDNEDIYLESSQ
ncbi:MAG: hypothetical protein JJ895_01470 [Balneolaceae bacterium]|nr:hypothetical protein [Balneolaceae bacterium]